MWPSQGGSSVLVLWCFFWMLCVVVLLFLFDIKIKK